MKPWKEFGFLPEFEKLNYKLKAICINYDYYDDIYTQPKTDSDKTQKQHEDYVFGNLICENSEESGSCYCGEENSKIYFQTPKAISNIDSDAPLCSRFFHCVDGLIEYRFETSNLEYEEDCDANIITICSFDLDPMYLLGDSDSDDSGLGFQVDVSVIIPYLGSCLV